MMQYKLSRVCEGLIGSCTHQFSYILCVIFMAACMSSEETSSTSEMKVGDVVSSFTLKVTLPDAEDWRYSDKGSCLFETGKNQGRQSVIVFFHTTCPDCQKELPVLQELYNHIKNDCAREMVCIARAQEASDIQAYWQENGLTLPFSPQSDRSIYSLFASAGIPRIYITDSHGVVTHIFTDTDAPSLDELKEALNRKSSQTV